MAISRKSVFSPSVLAKREMFSSSSVALAVVEPSSHSNRTPLAINTRYTHQERKMMSANNLILTIISLFPPTFISQQFFFSTLHDFFLLRDKIWDWSENEKQFFP